jgi:hypothetical protein
MGTEQENKARKDADDPKNPDQQYNGWWFNHPGPIERLTGWLVLWTALLFVGTMSSTFILWRTDNTLRETLDASNRAWISVIDASLDNEPAEGLPLLGHLTYQNIGRAPALNANYVMFLQGLPTKDAAGARKTLSDDACRAVIPGNLAIFPNEKHAVSFPYGKEGIATSAILSGETRLYWRGCFQYETFEKKRHTQFCFYLRHSGPAWNWQECGTDAN